MIGAQIQWGGEDPTAIAWASALAYVVAGALCLVAGARSRCKPEYSPTDRGIWITLGGFLVLLGLNKQLDLHTLFVHAGRDAARALGFYSYKRQIEGLFFIGVTTGLVAIVWHQWRRLASFGIAHQAVVVGLGLIAIYTITRFAAIMHLAERWPTLVDGAAVFIAFELVGSIVIGWAAVADARG
jgi:hypothetical protein